jgi:DNA ligase (NAD+)|nr:MAG TPA: DNA ligase [Caudoviricetes sp.]
MDQIILDEIRQLQAQLREYDYHYHVLSQPLIPDHEYDQLFLKLKTLEQQYPESITTDSPTQRVGYLSDKSELQKVKHPRKMMSLENAFTLDDIQAYLQTCLEKAPILNQYHDPFIVEPKYDGLACKLTYTHGVFDYAVTRGDGEVGELIPHFKTLVKGIPLYLPEEYKTIETIEVIGEVLLFKETLHFLNERLEQEGKKPYLNCRNAASGILRSKTLSEAQRGCLTFMPYGLLSDSELIAVETQYQALNQWLSLKFKFNVYPMYYLAKTKNDIHRYYNQFIQQREALPFDIDGMVIKVNPVQYRDSVGYSNKFPKWATAWKFSSLEKVVRLHQVDYQVGRTGTITPVARIDPVELLGVTVSNCTLHNFDEIKRLDLKLGCHVRICRSGDVIPKILGREYQNETDLQEIGIPTHCPCCNTLLQQDEGMVDVYCPNRFCQDQIRRGFHHFVSRKAMDIRGLGIFILNQLIDAGKLRIFADIYTLDLKTICQHTEYAEKGGKKLLKAINDSRDVELYRLLIALGIPEVGEVTAKLIATKFAYLDDIVNASKEALREIDGVGDTVADAIHRYFKDEVNLENLSDLYNQLSITNSLHNKTPQTAYKGTVVITGTFGIPRDKIAKMLESHGFKVLNNVSKKTQYLLAGENAGSKLARAEELGISIYRDVLTLLELEKGMN